MPYAVVTGSSSGIGRATAFRLAKSGFSIILHARRNLAGLQEVARQITQRFSVDVACITADIACPDACKTLVDAAFSIADQVNTWVNNAGADILTTAAAQLPFSERLRLLWNVDVQGTIRLSRLASLRMLQNPNAATPPSIINVGWDQAEGGMEGEPGQLFGTTKAAVQAFSRSLAMTVAPHVRVNCVAPGWIQTSWGEAQASPYWNERACRESLLRRWGQPDEVAQTIAWLASAEANFINGQCISVNGGRSNLTKL